MVIANGPFWVVDVEGNGASPPEIVEMAMIEVKGLALTGRQFHWLIKPEQPIQPAVSKIHGLTDADVSHAPMIGDIADDVLTWLEGAIIVGHNVRVEVDAITRSFPDWSPAAAIDTLRLARALKPNFPSYALGKLAESLNIKTSLSSVGDRREHSAIYDASLTALLFIDLLNAVPDDGRSGLLNEANILNQRQGTLL